MDDVSKEFIEQLGLLIERIGGFSRIAGKMFGLLMLVGRPQTLDELADELQISKASASTNARILEQVGILERRRTFGDRRDYWCASEMPWEKLFLEVHRRGEALLRLIDQTAASLPPGTDEARQRLDAFRNFYRSVLDAQSGAVQRMRTGTTAAARISGPSK